MNKHDEFYKRVLNNDGNAVDTVCKGVHCRECILSRSNVKDELTCSKRENEVNIKIIKDYFNQKGENEMNKFNLEEFKQGKFAVHCDTEDKANDFFERM